MPCSIVVVFQSITAKVSAKTANSSIISGLLTSPASPDPTAFLSNAPQSAATDKITVAATETAPATVMTSFPPAENHMPSGSRTYPDFVTSGDTGYIPEPEEPSKPHSHSFRLYVQDNPESKFFIALFVCNCGSVKSGGLTVLGSKDGNNFTDLKVNAYGQVFYADLNGTYEVKIVDEQGNSRPRNKTIRADNSRPRNKTIRANNSRPKNRATRANNSRPRSKAIRANKNRPRSKAIRANNSRPKNRATQMNRAIPKRPKTQTTENQRAGIAV